MGVNRLTALLRRFAPTSIRKTSAAEFAQKTLAFDASCHLNRFMYGEDIHPHRHIYGFYLLVRFCTMNKIKPIFVFDGPNRLAAKRLETARRERNRRKVTSSLLFERERSARLDSWLELSDEECSYLTDEAAHRILSHLNNTFNALEEEQKHGHLYAETDYLADAAETRPLDPEEKAILDQQRQLESRIIAIATNLRHSMEAMTDTDRYTRNVRALSTREYDMSASLIRDKLKNIKNALHELRADNLRMLTSLEKRSITITQQIRDECKQFLETLGYLCFTCDDHEAEAMCTHLCLEGRSDAVVSEDMDTVVFGNVPLLRYFFSKSCPILHIDPANACVQLGLSRESFIDLCILCGTDFSSTIHGIGPIRALRLIQQHSTIENVLENIDQTKYPPDQNFDYDLARKTFNTLPLIPTTDLAYQPPVPDQNLIREALAHYSIDPREAENRIQSVALQEHLGIGWDVDPFSTITLERYHPTYTL